MSTSKIILTGLSLGVTTGYGPLWGTGPTAYAQLLSGAAMEVVSASANDAAAGTGARTIKVCGLDGNYVPFTEIVTMNGATPVALTNTSAIAINGMEVLTAGSGATNAGRIDARVISGGAIKASIRSSSEGQGTSSDFIYTVPAGFYGKLKSAQIWTAGLTAGYLQAVLRMHTPTGVVKACGTVSNSLDLAGFSGPLAFNFGSDGLYIPPKHLITLVASMSAATASFTSAMGELELSSI